MTNNTQEKRIIFEFINYLKKPFHFSEITPLSTSVLKKIVGGFAVIFVFEMIALSMIQMIPWIEEIPHAFEDIINMNPLFLLGMTVLLAPIIEEFIFRFPLKYIKPYFAFLFYVVTLLFAFLHIFNFDLSGAQWLLAPLLVLPQLVLGLYLGFVRMKHGIWASITIHALNNLIPTSMILLAKAMDIPM